MKKRNILFSLIVLCFTSLSFSQEFNVLRFQKVNELNGNFSGVLHENDSFGVSNDYIGDLDGNGVNDLAVGAYTDDDGGFNRGAVWILFLDENHNVISHTKISSTSGNFTGELDNEDLFGGAISYLGDLNGDGLIEIAVGADYDGDGGFWHGAVWILTLNPDGTVNSHVKISDTEGEFLGTLNDRDIFGTDIEVLGDMNGDGIQDIAISARRDGDGGPERGAVYILFMNADFTVGSFQKISQTEGNFDELLSFQDYFGGSITNIGDLNEDGVVDIVVGAYRDDDLIENSGSFYVLFLNSDGTVNDSQKISNLNGGLDENISVNALFGESIDGIIDLDGDGKIEVIVGAMQQENPTLLEQTGAFYIIELNNDGTVSESHLYTSNEYGFSGVLNNLDRFGGSVSVTHNLGKIVLSIGAYWDKETGVEKGAIWILEFNDILSVSDFSLDEIVVVPNPASSYFELRYSEEVKTVEIYDINGRFVKTFVNKNNMKFDISELSSGEYILLLKGNNKLISKKILKM